jgi:Lipoprotein LpqB beta-propeller domain
MKPTVRPAGPAAGVLALITALTASGCVSLPTAQSPGGLSSQNSSQGSNVRIWPQPPDSSDRPNQIVEQFLQAAAATVSEPLGAGQGQPQYIAQQYLTGSAAADKAWDSGQVAVLSSLNSVQALPDASCGGLDDCFGFTGDLVGGVDDQGMYSAARPAEGSPTGADGAGPTTQYAFHVTENAKHVYQIDQLPTGFGAALTQQDFAASYSNFNLYYLNHAAPTKSLIPVPVYLRSSVSDQTQATTLANDLFGNEPSWLVPVAGNAAAAPIVKSLSIQPSNGLTTVTVGKLGNCTSGQQACYSLAIQLLATFTGIASISGVQVCALDGSCSSPVFPGDLQSFGLGSNPRAASDQPIAYYLDPTGHQVWSLSSSGKGQPDKVGSATAQYGQLAVSPPGSAQNQLAALVNPAGTALSLGYPGSSVSPVQHFTGTSIGSLSWDDFGVLWFTDTAADGTVQVYRMDTTASQVTVQPVSFVGLGSGAVRSVAVAPDGQRLAVVIQGAGGSTYSVNVGIVQQLASGWSANVAEDGNEVANGWSNVSQVAWRDGTVLGVLGSPQASSADTIWELHSDGSQVVDPATQQLLNIGPPKNLVSFGWAANGELLAATQPQSPASGATPPASGGSAANLLSFSNTVTGWSVLVPGTLGNLPAASP